MKKLLIGIASVFLLLTIGCSSNQIKPETNPVYVTNAKKVYLLSPENMAGSVDNLQLLNGKFGDTTFTLFVYFQSDNKGIFMSLLNDFGTDMGSLSYDGAKVDFESAVFPANLKAEYILLDIQNAYYSLEALKEHYEKAGLDFVETETAGEAGEIVRIRQIKSKNVVIEQITISNNFIRIQNILRGYEYNLTEGEE